MLLFRYMNYINAVFSNADVILNQTQSGVAAIKQLMEKQSYKKVPCYHTWLGADFGKKQKNKDNIDETVKKIIGSRFILMTGTLEVRKNHKVVLDAFDKYLFAKGFKLVFVGREDWRNEEFLQRVLQHERINKDLYFLNRLNDESLDILYKNAFMLAFPSYDEGFGLPIVEALVRGTPVITADIDVMREVGGSLAIYFKQDDVEDLTKNILFYVDNKEAYNELCKKISYYKPKTWEYVIDNMEKILYLKDNKK